MEKEIVKDIVRFDLERLKGKKVAVNCRTKEQFDNFVDWVLSLGEDIDIGKQSLWNIFREDACLLLNSDLYWAYNKTTYLKGGGYEIISYEEALLKESKKDMKKENEDNEITRLQKKITNLQHSLNKKDEKIKNQALEISSLLSQKQHLQQQLDSEVSVKEKYSKSLIIIEYLENKLDNHSIGTRLKEYMIKPNIEGIL